MNEIIFLKCKAYAYTLLDSSHALEQAVHAQGQLTEKKKIKRNFTTYCPKRNKF